jgi:Zn-dependent protease with chaperone function
MSIVGHAQPRPWGRRGTTLGASSVVRTALIMGALIALLGIGGWAFGGSSGMAMMIVVGLAIDVGSYWFSDRIALAAHHAQPVTEAEAPRLYQIVRSLARSAEIPMPRVYVIPTEHANAFATGRGPSHAAVAVTAGLLDTLDDRELAGVLAHELSHVRNRDVLVATIAAGVAGVISSLGYALQWGLVLGNTGDRDRRDSGAAAIAWIVVAPIVAMLLQLALSRAREYGADSSGAELSRRAGDRAHVHLQPAARPRGRPARASVDAPADREANRAPTCNAHREVSLISGTGFIAMHDPEYDVRPLPVAR